MEEILARAAQIFLALAGAYLVALWFALAVWTYRDIGSRSQSVVTQVFSTLMVVLFSIPGAMLYMLLRPRETLDQAFQRSLEEEYLLQDLEELPLCHSCHRYVEDDFVLCPHCQATLRDGCKSCRRLIHVKWSVCPYCGEDQTERAAAIREQVEPPARRWIGRGGRTFRPIAPGTVIREVYPEAEQSVAEIAPSERPSLTDVAGVWPQPRATEEDLVASGTTLDGDISPQPEEPVRLFDRKRTRQRRKEKESHGDVAPAEAGESVSNLTEEVAFATEDGAFFGPPAANGHEPAERAEVASDSYQVSENGAMPAPSSESDHDEAEIAESQSRSAAKR